MCLILIGTTNAHAAKRKSTAESRSLCESKLKVPVALKVDLPQVTLPLAARVQAFRKLHEKLGPIFRYGRSEVMLHVTGKIVGGLLGQSDALDVVKPADRAQTPAPPGPPPRLTDDPNSRAAVGGVLDSIETKEMMAAKVKRAAGRALKRAAPERLKPVSIAALADFVAASVVHKLMFDLDLNPAVQERFHRVAEGIGNERARVADFRAHFDKHRLSILTKISKDSIAADLLHAADRFPEGWWADRVVDLYFTTWVLTRDSIAAGLVKIASEREFLRTFGPKGSDDARARLSKELVNAAGLFERRVVVAVRVDGYLIPENSRVWFDPGASDHDALIYDLATDITAGVLTEVAHTRRLKFARAKDASDGSPGERTHVRVGLPVKPKLPE